MYKKMAVSLLLVMMMLVVTSMMSPIKTNASMDTDINLPTDLQDKVDTKVKLINQETGEIIYLTPKLVKFQRDTTGLTEISYEVGIPSATFEGVQVNSTVKELLFPSEVIAASKNYNTCDSTSSGCANLTFYYTDFTTHMYANYVRVVWTKLDSQILFISGREGVRCYADWWNRSGTCIADSYRNISSPVSGTTYNWVPSFAGSGNQTEVGGSDGQYAYQVLNMRRGSTNWEFYTCVTVGGAEFGWC